MSNMIGTRFDKTRNMVVECSAIRQLRKHMKDPGLFIYYHKVVKTFTLASWVSRGSRMYELFVLGSQPNITRKHREKLELMVTANPKGRANVAATKLRLHGEEASHRADCHQNKEELIDAQQGVRDALVKRNPGAIDHPYFWAANKRDNRRIKVSMHTK